MTVTQDNSLIAIDTKLGKDVLLLTGIRGREGLSKLFRFDLTMLSSDHNIDFKKIIGEKAAITYLLADGAKRYFHGTISHFSQGRGGDEKGGDPRFSSYSAIMVPWLWLLTRTTDSRIFQKLSVPDIVEKILSEKNFLDYEIKLHGSYDKREYCVQYRETDFNFISRLMEDEGIFYFFKHDKDKHSLVLADTPEENKSLPNQPSAKYQISANGWFEEDVLTGLTVMQRIRPGKYTLNDYNFTIPDTDLKVDAPSQKAFGPGEREIYDYPGDYDKRAAGDRLANIRMQQEEAKVTKIEGTGNVRDFTSGYRFELTDYFRDDMNDKEYILTEIEHSASQGGYPGTSTGNMAGEFSYGNTFKCIPFDIPYRPPLVSKKPVIHGSQTAIVVGPSGEEIYTEEHGRVKVQFHWDREGKNDENSSCWIRVSHPWAGMGWGSVSIPRIGQEVIVDFLEGNPDRPIVTGRVYHGKNMPPFGLPNGGVVSGLKTNSTPGGGGFNEMTMDDTKGKEKVNIHGQYNMSTTVQNDQSVTVKSGNRTMTIESGTLTDTVKGNTSLTVQAGSRTVSVTGGDYSTTASKAVKIHGKSKGVAITGNSKGVGIMGDGEGVGITGKGKGVSVVGKGGPGVSISGTPNFEASGKSKAIISSPSVDIGDKLVKVHGTKIQLSAGSGSIVIDATGVTIKGALIKIN